MPKSRPAKPVAARKGAPPPPSRTRRLAALSILHLAVGATLVAGVAYAARAGRAYVERVDAEEAPGTITVVLADRPAWMGDYLARQIAAAVPHAATSPFDHDRLVAAAAALRANPWVRAVRQVRRAYGDAPGDTIVVDCEYRAPAALIRTGNDYWLVDNDGIKLPEPFAEGQLSHVTVGADGRTALRVVTGVRQPPPPAGRLWPGADVAAALDTAKLLFGKPYLDEVTGVDVSNFGGRLDRRHPQVVLGTKYNTSIWWGRPPLADDFFVEVPVARKLATLAAVVRQYGRVDGGKPFLDVRFDTPLLPADEPAAP